ncbi:MAG TPA: DUF5658 family protein [Acidimicrobiales bacterium]|nr:DUF5658 family protein [Acidimicrobiales bacterium]
MRVAELQIWEEPRELWLRSMLVVAILLLNVFDVLTTETMLARGGTEMNPLSAWLIHNEILPHTKLSVCAFIAVAAAAAAGRRRVSNLLMMVASFYLVVVAGNSVQLLIHG